MRPLEDACGDTTRRSSFPVLRYTSLHASTVLLHIAHPSGRELPAEEVLEGLAILSELLDTLVQLVERHLVLEEGPTELGLVVDEGDLLERLTLRRGGRVELLRHGGRVVLQLLEQLRCDSEEVDARERLDLASVTEGCAHDDRLVVVLLVVVEDLLHGLHTGVVVARVVLARLVLVEPVENLNMTSAKPKQMWSKNGGISTQDLA